MSRAICFFIFDRFQLLDLSGPLAVFELAQRYARGVAYRLVIASEAGGPVRSSCGLAVPSESADHALAADTLIVVGGLGTAEAARSPRTQELIQRWAGRARRVCSVCTGTYFLAAAGLLQGRRATTHWDQSETLGHAFPQVRLEPDRIFVRDGNVWTSAGVTAGIDLALALIEEDCGPSVAQTVARQLVVYHRRTGAQPQLSSLLNSPQGGGRFGNLLVWIREHIGEPLQVEQLAGRANLSPRHFARLFLAEVGTTPAKMVETIRLEVARAQIEAGRETMDRIARDCGFGEAERMRRAFLRACGHSPQAMRRGARERFGREQPVQNSQLG